jgi:trehalose 2-sulfotransferase
LSIPNTSYLICATPRSGGHYLCEALMLTGVAGRPEEFFEPPNMPNHARRWGISITTNYREYFLKALEQGTTPNGVFGAKVMWGFFRKFASKLETISQCEGTPELMADVFPNLHYVWLRRRDKVRQAISYARAMQSDIWVKKTEAAPDRTVTFDFEQIDDLRHRSEIEDEKWRKYFDRCGVEPFTVVYEDFCSAYEDTLLKLLNYLSIKAPISIPFHARARRQQADATTEEWVKRYSHECGHRARPRRMPSASGDAESGILRIEIEAVVPAGARVVFVNKGAPLELADGRAAVAFPPFNDDGWPGYPADDAEAISVLQGLRAQGIRFVALPTGMRYWLKAYPEWASYLSEHATTRADSERVLIFELP